MKLSCGCIFFTFLLLISLQSFAQKNGASINGKIITADGRPAYVTVELKSIKKITATDNEGNFKFQGLPALNDSLVITSAEFDIKVVSISLKKDETLDAGIIRLDYKIGQLQNIEITGRTSRSFKSDYSFLGTKTQTTSVDIPQSISAITKELVKDRMDFTLKEVVNDAAGVNSYSGFDEYTIRGFKAENARLINGLRGYNTSYTSPMLVNIERIEIVKGPAATLYGNSDPGGTINLVTKKPLQQKQGEISFSAGTWNHYRMEGDMTGPLNKNKTWLYRFNAGYDNTKSFRKNFFARSYEMSPSLSFIPNDNLHINIDFSLSHINTILDRGQPGFENDLSLTSTPMNLIISQPGDYLRERDMATNVLLSDKINKNISFNSGYLNYVTQQNTNEHGIQSYITSDSVNLYFSNWDYYTTTNTFTNYFTFRFNTGKFRHQFLAGYDYIKSEVRLKQHYYEVADQFGTGSGIVGTFSLRNPYYFSRQADRYALSHYDADASNVEPSEYRTQGIYLQELLSYNKLKLLLGLRQEIYNGGDDDDSTGMIEQDILLSRVGLVYELRPNVSLYATYNKGFDPFEASTSTQVFNEPFKPIISELFEAGAKANFLDNKLGASIAIYQLMLQNVAVNANDISNPDLYIQQGEDRSRGVEAEVNGNVFPSLSIAASYSHNITKVIKSKITGMQGTIVENAPKNSSNTWIKYTFIKGAFKGFSIAAGHSQVGIRNTLQKGFTLPGYVVLNAGIRYTNKQYNIALNLNNITNEKYWLGAYNMINKWPGTPVNFMISCSYNF